MAENGKMHFLDNSEKHIVHGLLVVLLTTVEGRTVTELQVQSPLTSFNKPGLHTQPSASCSQGLSALSETIIAAAKQAQVQNRVG